MRTIVKLLALALLISFRGEAAAQEVKQGVGLLCDTPDQISEFVSAYTGNTDLALQKVNATEPVCAIAQVVFFQGGEVAKITIPQGTASITEIAVLAILVGQVWVRSATPVIQYTVTMLGEGV